MDSSELPGLAQPIKGQRRRRGSRSRRRRFLKRYAGWLLRADWRIVVLAVVFGLATLVVAALILITDANNRVQAALTSLDRVVDTVTNKPGTELTLSDFDRLESSVDGLNRDLAIARRQLSFLGVFSFVDRDLDTTLHALEAASELGRAADEMLTGIRPTVFFLVAGEDEETVTAQISSGERVVELLSLGGAQFVSADRRLNTAESQIDNLDLAGISPNLFLQVDRLRRTQQQLRDINAILLDAPDLLTTALGLDEPKSYIILAQNSDELRPSGGYISTFGWMGVRNGRLTEYNYSPTTATSPNPPSREFVNQLDIPDWWIQYRDPIYVAWDGSWFADFPSTAEMARQYYDNGDNPLSPVDGVFAIDVVGFEYLLEGLGRVALPEYDLIVTTENFREVVYDIRAFGASELAHKQFVADVYQQIFSDWQTVDRDTQTSTDVFGATLRALQEKHLMFYFTDQRLNNAVRLLGWSGAQAVMDDHDYLMVADANLGNKSSRSVIRQLTYDVVIQNDGSLESRASVAYDYPAQIADNDPAVDPEFHGPLDYNTLIQVFVPASSMLTDTRNLQAEVESITTEDRTTFISQAQIDYDSGERFQYFYRTDPIIERFGPYRRYRLLLQKQPGMIAEPVNVQITLPMGVSIVSTSPPAAATFDLDSPVLEFRTELRTDQWIEIVYQG